MLGRRTLILAAALGVAAVQASSASAGGYGSCGGYGGYCLPSYHAVPYHTVHHYHHHDCWYECTTLAPAYCPHLGPILIPCPACEPYPTM